MKPHHVARPTLLDRAIAWVSPVAGLRRQQARRALASAYEAARPSRVHQPRIDTSSSNRQVSMSAVSLREQARDRERNSDLARGILSTLVRNTIGAEGILVEPMPRTLDGDVHDELAEALRQIYAEWSKRPEVTWRMSWPRAQRMLARSWYRDGDAFAQELVGEVRGLDHGTEIPYSLELLEADFVPFYDEPSANIVSGIELNQWGRPRGYWAVKRDPVELRPITYTRSDLKRIPAERMRHLAMTDRITQLRGISLFASVLIRLDNLADYETSEQIAAKVAASMAAYIAKGTPDDYSPEGAGEKRSMTFTPGMIFDDLMPGETIGMIDSKRPSAGLEDWRRGQLRAAAAGTEIGGSSASKDYDGTYSSRRQELIEQWMAYAILGGDFSAGVVRPVYETVVATSILSGALTIPGDADPTAVADALYSGVPMPSIDPNREARAFRDLLEAQIASPIEIIRRRGQSPRDVADQTARWQRMLEDAGVALAEASTDSGGSNVSTAV